MRTPAEIFKKNVLSPAYRLYEKNISGSALHKDCQKLSSLLYGKGSDIALVMLLCNAISILSSHIAQIRGLKKSNRENKDYLISQERIELGLDLVLTTIPPSIINYKLKRKLETGEIITRKTEALIIKMAEEAGVSPSDILKTNAPKSYRQNVKQAANTLLYKLKTITKSKPKKLWNLIKPRNINIAEETVKNPILEEKLQQVYNKAEYKNFVNRISGATILTTVAYTILISSIVMPIIKNLLANYSYKKQLERMGETPESIRRKKRYNSLIMPEFEIKEKSIFDNIENFKNTPTPNKTTLKLYIQNNPPKYNGNVFENIMAFKSSGLRI